MTDTTNLHTYPPIFRLNHKFNHDETTNSETPIPVNSLPVIDFQLLNHEKLGQVCKEWGMFRLVNHGVPEKLLSQLLEYANKLFSQDFESKQGLFTDPILYFWGSPALTLSGNANQTDPCVKNVNWLEGFDVPLTKASQFRYEDPMLESFRSLLEEYGNHQGRVAKELFKTMAQDLDFSPTKLEPYLSIPSGFLRAYRYLQCPIADQRWGIDVHTDSSVLSILHQDEVGGLQVHKNNKWWDVEPVSNTLIVNIGDMMQAMSDDRYTSATHRVKVHRNKERLSVGYFVFPDKDAVVESSRYNPFSYADFQATIKHDLKTVGIKIGLPRFKIAQT